MPDDPSCVKALLRSHGFFQQPDVKDCVRICNFFLKMSCACHDGQEAIVQVQSWNRSTQLYAIMPDKHTNIRGDNIYSGQYRCLGATINVNACVVQIWVRWADRKDHSPIPRKKGAGGSLTITNRFYRITNFFTTIWLPQTEGKSEIVHYVHCRPLAESLGMMQ